MKTTLISIIFFWVNLFFYGRQNATNQVCYENMQFKKYFFSEIACIEKSEYGYVKDITLRGYDSTLVDDDIKTWLNCLDTISMYAPVSWAIILQFHPRYPYHWQYEADKKGWYEWYENNKCNNIQIKKREKA